MSEVVRWPIVKALDPPMPLDEMCPVCGGNREEVDVVLCVGCRPLASEWKAGGGKLHEGEPGETYYARLNRQADSRGAGNTGPDLLVRRLAAAVVKDAIQIVERGATSGASYRQAWDFLFSTDPDSAWPESRRLWCARAGIDELAMRQRLPHEIERRRVEKELAKAASVAAKAAKAAKGQGVPR